MSFRRIVCRSALSLALLGAFAAQAADPAAGELNDETLALEWAGSGPYVAPNLTPFAGEPVPILCEPTVPVTCDQYALTVNISDEFRELPENQRESVRINIDFPVTTSAEDYDLYLYDGAGTLMGESANLNGIVESITVPLKSLKNGSYTVEVIPFTPMATNYTGGAKVGKGGTATRSLSIVPQVGRAPLTVTLDARSLSATAPAGGYTFEFGDGSAPVIDEDGVVEHTYMNNGQYLSRVRFTGTSGSKALASASQTVFVGELAAVGKSGSQGMGGAFGAGALLLLAAFGRARRR